MQYPTKSSLQNHYIQSILPECYIFQQKQIPKSKQFYRPEKFIWNNPHRVSSRLYPYYHKFNDAYVTQMEEQDRKSNQARRISRLKQKRCETRNIFLSRKQRRIQLEQKSLSNTNHSVCQSNTPKNRTEVEHPTRTFSHKNCIKTITEPSQIACSQRLKRLEHSYQSGVLRSIRKQHQITGLIQQQRKVNHDKIKCDFDQRKFKNREMMTKLRKITSHIAHKA